MKYCRQQFTPFELEDNSLKDDEKMYIAELQRYLRVIPRSDGSPRLLAIDGIYGEETRREVMRYQYEREMKATGVVDLLTWEAIFEEYKVISQQPENMPTGR